MLEKINIHQNKKLHQALSHLSAFIMTGAAVVGMVEASQPEHRVSAVAQNAYAINQSGENEVARAPVNLGIAQRSASVSGKL